MIEHSDRTWSSADGLALHYRDYPGRSDRPPVICLHGLTRNARDFAHVAQRLSGAWRVICPDLRGRGESGYAKEAESYNPLQYVADLELLLAQERIDRFVVVGTSLGGLMAMILAAGDAAAGRQRLAGALLNDIGPMLERGGLEKIREYVGQGRTFPTWMHAARWLEEVHRAAYPDYAIGGWLGMAKRLMTLTSVGRIVFDYDMKLAEPVLAADLDAPQPDLWPGIDAMARGGGAPIPVALVRGALSLLLSPETFAGMQRRLPHADAVTVPRVGHAPTLDEPAAAGALDRLLARVAAADA